MNRSTHRYFVRINYNIVRLLEHSDVRRGTIGIWYVNLCVRSFVRPPFLHYSPIFTRSPTVWRILKRILNFLVSKFFQFGQIVRFLSTFHYKSTCFLTTLKKVDFLGLRLTTNLGLVLDCQITGFDQFQSGPPFSTPITRVWCRLKRYFEWWYMKDWLFLVMILWRIERIRGLMGGGKDSEMRREETKPER